MRRRRRSSGGLTRRNLLVGAGAAMTGAGLTPTAAFSQMTGARGSNVELAMNGDAVVGLYVYDEVEKNSKDPIVDVTNNYSEDITITVSLVDCTEGTLEAPDGSTGCSVSGTVAPGNTKTWYINSDVGNSTTIKFNVTGSGAAGSLEFSAQRSTTAVNKTSDAVKIKKYQKGNPNEIDYKDDQFIIKEIEIQDNDGDDDITRRKFTATDSNGNSVPLKDTKKTADPDKSFAATGTLEEKNFRIQADADLVSSESYDLKLTGYDADGNKNSVTRTF